MRMMKARTMPEKTPAKTVVTAAAAAAAAAAVMLKEVLIVRNLLRRLISPAEIFQKLAL
jgi:hypothetical protein